MKSLSEILGKTGITLLKIRGLVSLTSILSEYWISYFSLLKSK